MLTEILFILTPAPNTLSNSSGVNCSTVRESCWTAKRTSMGSAFPLSKLSILGIAG